MGIFDKGGHRPSDALIARYLNGVASADEMEAVRRWLASDARAGNELDELARAWERTGAAARAEVPPSDPNALWSALATLRPELRGRVEAKSGSFRQGRRSYGGRIRSLYGASDVRTPLGWRLGRFAAAAALVAVAVGLGVVIGRQGSHPLLAQPVREYVTGIGQREAVTLSDGTQITVAPLSRLRILYGDRTRAVTLDGEALFTVVHDVRRPFTVRSGTLEAADVGTSFDVRAYASDPAARIAVAEGRVAFAACGRGSGAPDRKSCGHSGTQQLAAGDVATIGTDGTSRVVHGVDVVALTQWATGTLSYVGAPLPEVLADLDRWYGIDVRVADSVLAGRHVTASFASSSIDVVLASLAAPLGAHITRSGATYMLVADRRSQP